ncbi:unnamed protein product [Calypogeia fissa]
MVLLSTLLAKSLVFATYYSLGQGWNVKNNDALDVQVDAGETLRVVFVDTETSSFALAFVNISDTLGDSSPSSNRTDAFILGIVTMPYTDLWEVVWSANANSPVGTNASLGFKLDGNLALWDANGAEVWSTDAPSGVNIIGLDMDKSGNLVMVDTAGDAIWQSFTHPTNVILPGQVLQVGATLVINSSGTDPSLPFYQLVVEHVGLALYAPSSLSDTQKLPYYVSSLNAQQDLDGVTTTCLHPAMVTFNSTQGLMVSYDMSLTFPSASNSTLCSETYGETTIVLSSNVSNNEQNIPHQFVRLDADGNLRMYVMTDNFTAWQVVANVSSTKCDLPGACSKYGICFRDRCTCADSTKVEEEPVVEHLLESSMSDNPADQFLSCKPPNTTAASPGVAGLWSSDNCTSTPGPGYMQEIVTVASADYFSNQYVTPDYSTPTMFECGQRCLNSCSCSASFYHNDSGACFLVADVHSLQKVPQTGYFALLKAFSTMEPEAPSLSPGAQSRSASGKSSSDSIAIGVSVGLGSAGVLLGFLFWTLYRLLGKEKGRIQIKKFHEEEGVADEEDEFLHSLPGLPQRYTLKELSLATNGFQTRLGNSSNSGGFGSVYDGSLGDGSRVAVKKLDAGKHLGLKEFRAEVATIGSIRHTNLVRLRGFCFEGVQRFLIYEYIAKGSLDKWLFAPKEGAEEFKTDSFILDWNTRYRIALGTARGLGYLHEECPSRIIHSNMKPQNILLDDRFSPKISDYGLSKLMAVGVEDSETSGELTTRRGTPGYLAPELLLRSQVSDKIDIYSYGVVLIELFTGRRCIDLFMEFDSDYFPSWAMNMARDGRLREALDKRLGDLVPEVQCQRVIQIAYWCVHRDFKRRPTMRAIVQMLEGLLPVPEMPEAELADLSSFKLPGKDKRVLSSPSQELASTSESS